MSDANTGRGLDPTLPQPPAGATQPGLDPVKKGHETIFDIVREMGWGLGATQVGRLSTVLLIRVAHTSRLFYGDYHRILEPFRFWIDLALTKCTPKKWTISAISPPPHSIKLIHEAL